MSNLLSPQPPAPEQFSATADQSGSEASAQATDTSAATNEPGRIEAIKSFFKEHKVGAIATGVALVGAAAVGVYIAHKTGVDFIPGITDASPGKGDTAHKVIEHAMQQPHAPTPPDDSLVHASSEVTGHVSKAAEHVGSGETWESTLQQLGIPKGQHQDILNDPELRKQLLNSGAAYIGPDNDLRIALAPGDKLPRGAINDILHSAGIDTTPKVQPTPPPEIYQPPATLPTPEIHITQPSVKDIAGNALKGMVLPGVAVLAGMGLTMAMGVRLAARRHYRAQEAVPEPEPATKESEQSPEDKLEAQIDAYESPYDDEANRPPFPRQLFAPEDSPLRQRMAQQAELLRERAARYQALIVDRVHSPWKWLSRNDTPASVTALQKEEVRHLGWHAALLKAGFVDADDVYPQGNPHESLPARQFAEAEEPEMISNQDEPYEAILIARYGIKPEQAAHHDLLRLRHRALLEEARRAEIDPAQAEAYEVRTAAYHQALREYRRGLIGAYVEANTVLGVRPEELIRRADAAIGPIWQGTYGLVLTEALWRTQSYS